MIQLDPTVSRGELALRSRRRHFIKSLAALSLCGSAILASAEAQATDAFPSATVRIVVGFAAGGGVDIVARLLASKLSVMWGQSVIVDNRPGASGMIAAGIVAKEAPDGLNVVMAVPNSHSIGPHLIPTPYDALKDFTPLTLVVQIPNVLVVGRGVQVNDMAGLVALAKANPGKLNFGSSGVGSTQQLAGEMFNLATGAHAVHVPYKGSATALSDVMSGVLTMSFDTTTGTMGFIQGGTLKALAVMSPQRIAALPRVPTTAEAGYPKLLMSTWYGLMGPAGMPKAIADKWQRDVASVLQMPDVRARIAQLGGEPVGDTPAQFQKFYAADYAQMGEIVKAAHIAAK